MTVPSNLVSLPVTDSSRMLWSLFAVPQLGAQVPSKVLLDDTDTGIEVFRRGAHGMVVLDGVLAAHEGDDGPGSFVRFPDGGWMQRGATADNDCTFLFITDEPFAICNKSDPGHSYPTSA